MTTETPAINDAAGERWRDQQQRKKIAAAVATSGRYIHRHPRVTPGNMTRAVRRGMAAIVADAGLNPTAKRKAVARLLRVDALTAREFLAGYTAAPPKAKPKAKRLAFNHTPNETRGEDGKKLVNRFDLRNAAKAERKRPRKPGPAEQPRTPRSARYQRRQAAKAGA